MATIAKSSKHAFVKSHAIYQDITHNADHVDIKSAESTATMPEFIAGVFNYQPDWVTFLYRVRKVFVRMLGLKQEGIPQPLKLDPNTLDLVVGDKIAFFDIDAVQPNDYLVVSASESHLKATLALFREPLSNDLSRYYAVTVVHYNNWAGPIYFNVIRPFHHVVVHQMLKAGAKV